LTSSATRSSDDMVNEPEGEEIEADIWSWIREFVTVRNDFYGSKFAPCPFAQQAVTTGTVDVAVWRSGDVREFVRAYAEGMRDTPGLTTRVMAFPPRIQRAWGFSDYIESLNRELIPDNVFLNPGIAKNTTSKFPGSVGQPYFIVVANSLAAVLRGSEQLQRTDYYDNWPGSHVEFVVERRARLAERFSRSTEAEHL
jgi:hypothetical protein